MNTIEPQAPEPVPVTLTSLLNGGFAQTEGLRKIIADIENETGLHGHWRWIER